MASVAAPTRANIISLYTSMLRTSRTFASYNFRTYFLRNTRTKFRAHMDEKDPARVAEWYKKGLEELEVLKRAAIVNRVYEGPKLVVEKPKVTVGGGGAGMEASAGGAGQPV
ncbi:hypothetical protein FRB99_004160 [Tulasnella sp. 403]|nr:hypothetical protein FRB99_004160 [Tulasnella sp. 403]